MNRSFKDRLEALEALEQAAEAEQAASEQVVDETDADALDDDDLLAETWWGLLFSDDPPARPPLSFRGPGILAVARYWHPRGCPAERYWARVADRAGALCRDRGLVLFPLVREDAASALALLDSGVLICRPFSPMEWRSHHTTVRVPHNHETYALSFRLAEALDQVVAQTGQSHIETADELRAALVKALGDMDHIPIQETA